MPNALALAVVQTRSWFGGKMFLDLVARERRSQLLGVAGQPDIRFQRSWGTAGERDHAPAGARSRDRHYGTDGG
jgi:hypothetical protein